MKKRFLSLFLAVGLCLSLTCAAFAAGGSDDGHWDFSDPGNGPQWVEDKPDTPDPPDTPDTPDVPTPPNWDNDHDTSSDDDRGHGSDAVKYNISTPDSVTGGTVTFNRSSAGRGVTVTITVKPDSGYELDSLTVMDKDGSRIETKSQGNNKYTFRMPASDVTVDAVFVKKEAPAPAPVNFTDVMSGAYYYDAVQWAVAQGITNGTGANGFSPDAPCTRGQIVTFLWRAAGSTISYGDINFADVQPTDYYFNAVRWAVEQGITNGTGANTFDPNAACTRAQAVTFLYRYANSPAASGVNVFADVPADAYYADAVRWAVANQITNGTGAASFSPDGICTRGHIVTFLYRDLAA